MAKGGQGRGSARAAALLGVMLLLCLVIIQSEAALYTVGDGSGWTFNTAGWPRGKRFNAGDQLIFKYNPAVHNVVAVNGPSYNTCRPQRGARVYKSGNDRITLARGTNYFICTFVGHCESGMKIAVTAA